MGFLSPPTRAQFTSGTILGTVTDPSGAAIPAAPVTATNVETGFVRTVQTNNAGDYLMVNMPLGNYKVKAEASGFKTAVSGPFTLVVDQKLRSDFKLDLGTLAQVVEVKGVGATMLQTAAPDMNQIVQDKEIRALPLNGRDFLSLLLLSNGLQDTSNDQGGATTNVTFAVNGMRPEANSVTLDGIEMSTIREQDVDMRPNIDAISEFKVLTSTYSAEYGHTAGGVISIQTKGGTNTFHGNAYEFLRNDALNAPNFFSMPADPRLPKSSQNKVVKAPLKLNMFGATLGGPIQKNKTFFFADYQGYRVHKLNEAFALVPPEAYREGDFSSLLPASSLLDPSPLEVGPWGYPASLDDPATYGTGIYDPATGSTKLFRDPSRATPENPQGVNIIPLDRMHPLGYALMNSYPLPNLSNYQRGNYFIRQPSRAGTDEAGLRIDHTFSSKNNFFIRYRWNDTLGNTADALARPDGPMPGIGLETGVDDRGIVGGGLSRDRNNNLAVSDVHIFSPSVVNEARFGFAFYRLDATSLAQGTNLAEKFGLQGVNVDKYSSGLPIIYMSNYTNIGGDDWKPLYFRERSWQLNDNLTMMRGRHTLKTGFEYRPRSQNNWYTLFPQSAWWAGNDFTSYSQWWWSSGMDVADVLVGMPSMGFHGRRFGSPVLKDRGYSAFLQDDWKVADRLTLNLGVRYEYVTPFFSPANEISIFDMAQNKLLLAGKDGVSRYIVQPDRNNWAPRVGLAYKLRPTTTLRAGFGVFFDPENAKRDDVKFNPPSYRNYTTWDTWNFWSAEPPPFVDPGSYPTGYDTDSVALNLRTGYSEQYNFAIQHELPWGILVEAAYVGAQAHKLPYVFNYNPKAEKSKGRPISTLGDVNLVTNVGDMVYHSGQLKVERRFGKGLFFLTSYTWSKSIDNVSSADFDKDVNGGVQNIYDPKANRGVSDWDVPHRLAFSYVYDLPFGKGKQFMTKAHPVLETVFGNWQTTGIFIASSGVPGTVYYGEVANSYAWARPDLVGDPNLSGSQRGPDHWFNTEAFVMRYDSKGNILPGNAGRNIMRGPRYTNMDLGMVKFFSITERLRMQFRAEFFNLSNTPHFALPIRKMKDPSFGTITHTRNPGNYGSTAASYANRMIQFALKLEF
jgi:outer membrane receptor protein involved in Fe transport